MKEILFVGLALLVASCTTIDSKRIEPQQIYEIKCQDYEKDPLCHIKNHSLVTLEYRF